MHFRLFVIGKTRIPIVELSAKFYITNYRKIPSLMIVLRTLALDLEKQINLKHEKNCWDLKLMYESQHNCTV